MSSKLKKLVEFAEKGGIGTCEANQDVSAKSEADLMFLTGEVITVLKHIKDDIYLGYCEGVIGTFKGQTVKFNGSLKDLKSMKSEKKLSSSSQSSSPTNNNDKSSPKKSNSIDSVNTNSGLLENKSQIQPTINIIPVPSENIKIIVPSQRKSSITSERSVPISPRKLNTMPQLHSNPEPIMPQRRNNTVPIISISHEEVDSNQQHNQILNASPRKLPPQQSPVNNQNQIKYSDPVQIITRERQNSTSAVLDNRQNNLQNSPLVRPRSRSVVNGPNGPQIPGISNASIPHRIKTSNLQRNEHRRSRSIPNLNHSYNSPSSSPVSSPKSLYNKRHSQTFDSPTSISPNKPRDQETFMINGKSIPLSLQPRSSPGMNQSYKGYPNKVNGQNSQKYSMGTNKVINQKSVIGHYSPSTTPLPSPIMPQIKVLQEENVVINDQDSPSTTPLPSPRFAPRNISNNNLNHEGRVTAANTPAPTPVIITPKITLEDSDTSKITLEDSDLDDSEGESLISYRSYRNNLSKSSSSSSSSDPSKPTEVPTLRVNYFRSDTPDTPSEQLSANESEDISSEDEYENKVGVKDKDESESDVTQSSKSVCKKKEQILAIDEYGFVYDVSEEDIPPGADRIQRIIQAPGAEEKTTRTIRLYREREAKWVAILGMDPIMSRDSRKIKKLVRNGIPESVRGKAWQFMSCADRYRKPKVFDELRNREKLPIYDDIERDIHRCYPDHIQFREESGFGQDDLHNVLKAYAHYNPAVGYCQGMGRLVGMMLMQMPAEDSFWLLVATIEEYMVGYFTPTLSQVKIDSIVFEQLLFEHDPKLAQHLANNGVVPLMYMTQWFMTIFTMALPWASVLRVWDIFYFEGVKLFFRIGLAILDCTKEHLLKSCPTNAEILGCLLHLPHELLTPDLLLEAAFKIRLRRSAIRRLTRKAMEEGTDASITAASGSKEIRRGLMKKSKSTDKLRIDGVEFKLVGE